MPEQKKTTIRKGHDRNKPKGGRTKVKTHTMKTGSQLIREEAMRRWDALTIQNKIKRINFKIDTIDREIERNHPKGFDKTSKKWIQEDYMRLKSERKFNEQRLKQLQRDSWFKP